MAIQHGQCGAWKTVQRMLSTDLPGCQRPEHVDHAIAAVDAQRPQWTAIDQACVMQLIEQMDTSIRDRRIAIESVARQARLKFEPAFRTILTEIHRLEEAQFWLLRLINRHLRIPRLRQRLRNLEQLSMRQVHDLQRELRVVESQFHQLISNPKLEASRRTSQRQAQLDRLRSIRQSPEYAGAIAEWNNAEIFRRQLPGRCHLFHDVNVEMDKWYFIDGQNRRNAQIDHVVVSAGGVFVIETKLWSRTFAQGGQYYCPFKQVRAAGKLLHHTLKNMLGESIKVREIIATVGALPPKPEDSFAKILGPDEVAGYIGWFPQELDEQTIHDVVQLLSRMC